MTCGKKVSGFATGLGRLDVMCQDPTTGVLHLGHSGGKSVNNGCNIFLLIFTITVWSKNLHLLIAWQQLKISSQVKCYCFTAWTFYHCWSILVFSSNNFFCTVWLWALLACILYILCLCVQARSPCGLLIVENPKWRCCVMVVVQDQLLLISRGSRFIYLLLFVFGLLFGHRMVNVAEQLLISKYG